MSTVRTSLLVAALAMIVGCGERGTYTPPIYEITAYRTDGVLRGTFRTTLVRCISDGLVTFQDVDTGCSETLTDIGRMEIEVSDHLSHDLQTDSPVKHTDFDLSSGHF